MLRRSANISKRLFSDSSAEPQNDVGFILNVFLVFFRDSSGMHPSNDGSKMSKNMYLDNSLVSYLNTH